MFLQTKTENRRAVEIQAKRDNRVSGRRKGRRLREKFSFVPMDMAEGN
jgi:hypothetical protein